VPLAILLARDAADDREVRLRAGKNRVYALSARFVCRLN
jgi:hypothetical protein